MPKTPAGTKALLQKYLDILCSDGFSSEMYYLEKECARRIGSGNAVIVGDKIVTSHSTKEPKDEWLCVFNVITLDDSKKTPEIETPYTHMQDDDEPVIIEKDKEPKEKKKRKREKKEEKQ